LGAPTPPAPPLRPHCTLGAPAPPTLPLRPPPLPGRCNQCSIGGFAWDLLRIFFETTLGTSIKRWGRDPSLTLHTWA
jgi:hypothetical protein